jgi:hypothetical protein
VVRRRCTLLSKAAPPLGYSLAIKSRLLSVQGYFPQESRCCGRTADGGRYNMLRSMLEERICS